MSGSKYLHEAMPFPSSLTLLTALPMPALPPVTNMTFPDKSGTLAAVQVGLGGHITDTNPYLCGEGSGVVLKGMLQWVRSAAWRRLLPRSAYMSLVSSRPTYTLGLGASTIW